MLKEINESITALTDFIDKPGHTLDTDSNTEEIKANPSVALEILKQIKADIELSMKISNEGKDQQTVTQIVQLRQQAHRKDAQKQDSVYNHMTLFDRTLQEKELDKLFKQLYNGNGIKKRYIRRDFKNC